MLFKAREVVRGHYVKGLGFVLRVRIMLQAVANLSDKRTDMPVDENGKLLKGSLLRARLEQEAEDSCYDRVPHSIVLEGAGNKTLSVRPEEEVEVVMPDRQKILAAVAARGGPKPKAV
jgi:hypothetical protein